jgi:ferritin
MSNTSLLKGYFGEYEGQNLEDEKQVEKPSIFRMWKSDSPKPEISKDRSLNTVDSIIRQNVNEKVEEVLGKLYIMNRQCCYMLDSMAFYFGSSSVARSGFSKYLQSLCSQEMKHSDELLNHIQERGLTLNFEDIVKPSVSNWGTLLTAVVTIMDCFRNLNDACMQLHKLTIKYEDPCTELLVKKFICEHVSLISIFGRHYVNLKRIGEDGTGRYLYDLKSFRGEILDTDTDIDTILQ